MKVKPYFKTTLAKPYQGKFYHEAGKAAAMKKRMFTRPKSWLILVKKLIVDPKTTWGMLDTTIFSESWIWQFRKQAARLYRDVWRHIGWLLTT
jgi:hypothetical protein